MASSPDFHTAPGWYRPLLRAERVALRAAFAGKRRRAHELAAQEGGVANQVLNTEMGHLAAERLVPGQHAPALHMAQHAARYAWAMRLCEGKRVLDVGCGVGYGSYMLSWVADSVTAFDVDPTAIAMARERYAGVDYRLADVTETDIPEADVAVCFEVLEHVSDPARVLRAVIGAVPVSLFSFPNPLLAGSHLNPHHVNDWPLSTFRSELRKAGARRVTVFRQGLRTTSVKRGGTPWAAVWCAQVER
jgi:SAM-dependent methyltransferase